VAGAFDTPMLNKAIERATGRNAERRKTMEQQFLSRLSLRGSSYSLDCFTCWARFYSPSNLRALPPAPAPDRYACSSAQYEQTIVRSSAQFHHRRIMNNQSFPYDVFMQKLRDHEVDALKASPVLVIGNDEECTDRLVQTVHRRGLQAISCPGLDDAQLLLGRMAFSLVFCGESVLQGELRSLIQVARSIPVILLARRTEGDTCLDANHRGAFDCISCPPDPEETDSILTVALARPAHTHEKQEKPWATEP
jgi:hypothetical protein